MRQDLDKTPDGRPQGLYLSPRQDSLHILSPLAPTIRRIGPQSPRIVGAGEDVDVGMGPLWLPVRAHHHISSPYLNGIVPCGRPGSQFNTLRNNSHPLAPEREGLFDGL